MRITGGEFAEVVVNLKAPELMGTDSSTSLSYVILDTRWKQSALFQAGPVKYRRKVTEADLVNLTLEV